MRRMSSPTRANASASPLVTCARAAVTWDAKAATASAASMRCTASTSARATLSAPGGVGCEAA
jgi:hypothetical protein